MTDHPARSSIAIGDVADVPKNAYNGASGQFLRDRFGGFFGLSSRPNGKSHAFAKVGCWST